jgi:hypothetical protein
MQRASRLFAVLALSALLLASAARAQEEDHLSENLIPNGDLELDADGDGYPDGWPRAENAALVSEDGNSFLRVTPYGGPGFELPLEPDWIAVTVRLRMRCRGVEMGAEGWHDARMVMSWNDADHEHVDPWPDVLRGVGTFEWRGLERTFVRPPGAQFLSIGPSNFAAEGTVDYDDIEVRGKRRPPLRDLPLPAPKEALWGLEGARRQESITRGKVCLNGLWQFRPAFGPEEIEAPPAGEGWGYFKVPASWHGDPSVDVRPALAWEDAEVAGATAAWYGRDVTVPAGWDGREVRLRFDLVQSRAQLYVDGRRAGEVLWPGGTLDVTDHCRPGATHRLEVLALALPMDTQAQTFMGPDRAFEAEADLQYRGLCGDVYLLSSPPGPRIEDVFVQPSVQEARLAVVTELSLQQGAGYRLRARVEHEGQTVKEFASPPVSAADLDEGRLVLSEPWPDPPLWDTHQPRLCTLHLELLDGAGRVVDEALPVRFGFRDFVVRGRDFIMNGKRIHLRAVALSSAGNADTGSVDGARNTFARTRRWGFNFFIMNNYHFRTGGVNYFGDLLRAADEEGMLLSVSMPHVSDFGWNLEPEHRRESYERIAGWIVRQARHHPSVVLYAMNHNATGYRGDQNPEMLHGREGPEGNNRTQALRAEQIAAALDPTRPIYHHQSGNLGDFYTLNCYLNWAPIRERSRWLNVWATEGAKPFFFVEWGLPHIASWSSYRGPQFIWRAEVMQQAWTHEFAATFKGDDAYTVDESDAQCLRNELHFWQNQEPFHYWHLHTTYAGRDRNVLEIKSIYARRNWPAHRTWGVSAMLPWDQGDFWRRKEGAPSDDIPVETDWTDLQRPGVSPDRLRHAGRYLYSRHPEDDWEPTSIGRTIGRVNMPLLAYLAGRPGDFTEEDHNFLPGETVHKQIVVINDTREPVRCTCRWGLEGRHRVGEVTVEPGGIHKEPIAVELPADLPPGTHRLHVVAEFEGGGRQDDALDLHVLAPPPDAAGAEGVALYDPAGLTRAELEALGVPFTEVDAGDDVSRYELLIVGREALLATGPAPDISAVREGLKVLVFEQTEQVLQHRLGFRTQVYGLRRVFPRVPDHPALSGLGAEHLRDWRGRATLYPPYMEEAGSFQSYPHVRWCGFSNSRVWRCGTEGNVATALIEKPMRGDFLPIVDGGFDLQYAPLLECGVGRGRVVFCQMDVTGRSEGDPAARALIAALVRYCAEAPPRTARQVHCAGQGEARRMLERLGAAPTDGDAPLGEGDLIVVGPDAGLPGERMAEAARRGANVLLLANGEAGLRRAPVPCRWEVRTVMNSRLDLARRGEAFRGLSCAETHLRNFKDLPLLSEPEPADEHGLLASAELGAGRVVFCQLAPWMFDPEEFNHDRMTYRRTGFLLSRILANLGAEMENPLLEHWKEPGLVVPDMSAGWVGEPDPEDVGREEGWQLPEFDDSRWRPIEVPGTWESQRPELADYNGIFWYRKELELPVLPEDAELVLSMGAVDDEDWTYLNGELIGSITAETHEQHWAAARRYVLPKGALRPGRNVLAVRVRDTYMGGGIVRGPASIQAPGRWLDGYYMDTPGAGDDPYRYYRW